MSIVKLPVRIETMLSEKSELEPILNQISGKGKERNIMTIKEIKDNYTEIIQNISRHFNKKKLMREKIVNKTLCKPLPQIQLPKKQ